MGYDGLIILLAGINAYLFVRLNKQAIFLNSCLNKTLSIPIRSIFESTYDMTTDTLNLARLEEMDSTRNELNRLYHVFNAIITIFPLMGILGTVLALLGLIDFSSQDIITNFTAALTSTFWGLICAIIFRFLDSKLSATIQSNHESLNLLINRIDKYHQHVENAELPLGDAHD